MSALEELADAQHTNIHTRKIHTSMIGFMCRVCFYKNCVTIMPEMNTKHDSKYYATIGSLGGMARNQLHGNPGTFEGRSRGGMRSIEIHRKKKNTAFILTKAIAPISKNTALAEFIGILFGDGHVGKYQTSISLNSETDREYAKYVCLLIKNNFGIKPGMRKRKNALAVDITISSVLFSQRMVQLGMISGNKIHGDFRIPKWIMKSDLYIKAFIRGLFDTDGSIYIERKVIKKKVYRYIGMIITSASPQLRADIMTALQKLNLSPTNTVTQQSVFLRRKKDIKSYFSNISSHNSKHTVRYTMFLKEM